MYFIMAISIAVQAQPGSNRQAGNQPPATGRQADERIKAFRVAFFTDKLRLTPEESQQFWPLFNEFRDKAKAFRKDQRDAKPIIDMTDAEADAYIQDMLAAEEKEIALKREYYQKLRKVISARKLALLPQTEKDFNKTLLERMREFKEKRG